MTRPSAVRQVAAVAAKDLLCLRRDTAGLTVLFVMPLVLLVVMALVQDAVVSSGPENLRSELLVVDRDGGAFAAEIVEGLAAGGYHALRRELGGGSPDPEEARRAVLHGDVHAALIIPAGLSEAVARERGRRLRGAGLPLGTEVPGAGAPAPAPPLELVLDPTLPGALREAYLSVLSRLVLLLEVRALARELGPELPPAASGAGGHGGIDVRLEDRTFAAVQGSQVPTVTQQNVPAWTMFAMFFIVVPLATQMIRERNDGTLRRSLVAPVAYASLVTGKLVVYGAVCVAQFCLLSAAGMTLLPLVGLAPLSLGAHPGAIPLVVAAAAAAACGFGVLIGTVARSHVQASAFGAVVVIILAAVGGVMVPVYVMPPALREASVVSPLAWGLNAFLDVFMRGGGAADVLPEVGALLLFFVAALGGAVWYRYRSAR